MEQTQVKDTRKIKKYLKSLQSLQAEISDTEQQLAQLRQSRMHPSVRSDGEVRDKSCKDLSGYAAAVADLEQTLLCYRYRRMVELKRVMQTIEKMDSKEAQVIRLHYLRGMNWQRVADRMGFSESHIHRIHAKALQHFDLDIEEED
ncbi:MAG: hypothetical protein IJ711_02320 [Lachnospiraceae bacterium]|nr:hypothetical protein [Lachnospiraceae bacterium]